MLQVQKKAKKADTAPVTGAGNADAKAAALSARATLKALKKLKPSMKTLRNKVLTDSLKLFDKHGWVRRTLGNKEYGFCAIGAINHVEAPRKAKIAAVAALDKVLQKRKNYNGSWDTYGFRKDGAVVQFNDGRSTRKTDVVNLFKAAIKE